MSRSLLPSCLVALGVLACRSEFDSAATGTDTTGGSASDGDTTTGTTGNTTGDGTGTEETGGGSGDTDTEPPGCDTSKTPKQDPCVLDDTLGIFVATGGDDGNPGTMAQPVQTLAVAVTLAADGPGRVYACAEDFASTTLQMAGGVSIFGGLDCSADWGWIGDETRTGYTAQGIGMRIAGAGETAIADLEVTATAEDQPGASSIGIVIDGSNVSLLRANVTAGAGKPGTDGSTAGEPTAADGPKGGDGGEAASCIEEEGATTAGPATPNPACTSSIGAAGGSGGIWSASGTPGDDGSDGMPDLEAPTGKGGKGQAADYNTPCEDGTDGQAGSPGADGTGASGLGTLSASGWTPPTADGGQDGSPGEGGGGGGGAAGPETGCSPPLTSIAPGGAGGGAGGCGGLGGGPGGPGGSSLGLVSLNAAITLKDTAVVTGNGGDGGTGGDGQAGGQGGPPGTQATLSGSSVPCAGGTGGAGGDGGPGGGGVGGHAIGVAYTGDAPTVTTGVQFTLGVGGTGGQGGDGKTALAGADGKSQDTVPFE